jgi:hypothetical protein
MYPIVPEMVIVAPSGMDAAACSGETMSGR